MPLTSTAVPASVRAVAANSRFAKGLAGRPAGSFKLSGAETRAVTMAKSRFAPLPQEPEDARITGGTRSLTRRLLALNLSGTLQRMRIADRALSTKTA